MSKNRLIIALDFPEIDLAKKMVEEIADEGVFYKVGLELLASGSYFEMIRWLKSKNKKVFADLKLHDISETVAKTVQNLAQYEIDILTIHAEGEKMMRKAAEVKGKTKIVAVTVLTDLEKEDLSKIGFDQKISLAEIVEKKARLALDCGLDGIVASALEAKDLRDSLGNDFIIVSPGIRIDKLLNDDQKRVADVKTALLNGSSYLVVGRPITRDKNPKQVVQKINDIILNLG